MSRRGANGEPPREEHDLDLSRTRSRPFVLTYVWLRRPLYSQTCMCRFASSINLNQAVATLWAFAKLKQNASTFVAGTFPPESHAALLDSPPSLLSKYLWSLSKMSISSPLFKNLATAPSLPAVIAAANARDVSQIAWSYGLRENNAFSCEVFKAIANDAPRIIATGERRERARRAAWRRNDFRGRIGEENWRGTTGSKRLAQSDRLNYYKIRSQMARSSTPQPPLFTHVCGLPAQSDRLRARFHAHKQELSTASPSP